MARCGSCGRGPRSTGNSRSTDKREQDEEEQGKRGERIKPQRPGTRRSMTGGTQSFALATPDGRTRYYGSALERDAAHVRHGGRIVG